MAALGPTPTGLTKSAQASTQPLTLTPDQQQALEARRAAIRQEHPLYTDWQDTWRHLGYVYEGDGPYLDGRALVAHPRELTYAKDAEGNLDYDHPNGEKEKFKRRKRLARYENIAEALIEIILDHQYEKDIARTFKSDKPKPSKPEPTKPKPESKDEAGKTEDEGGAPSTPPSAPSASPAPAKPHPYLQWVEDVDGEGTHLSDWMKDAQSLAAVFGFVWITMDVEGALPTPADRPRSALEDGRPVLKCYIPQDCLDWLSPRRNVITAAKFVESRERAQLLSFPSANLSVDQGGETTAADAINVEFLIWDDKEWTRYDQDGGVIDSAVHSIGRCPVTVLYSRRRKRIPVIGRSMLGDPKIYQDLYNMMSEAREIMRGQTFSMLHVQLGDMETVDEAKTNLGAAASTESAVFSKGSADFIAPPDGPLSGYREEVDGLMRRVYRMIGLPWETDSADAESGDSRRLKANDLNRKLAGHADEAQRSEYVICELWFRIMYGGEAGLRKYQESGYTCKYPDEFHVQQILEAVEDARESMTLGLGPRANAEIRKRALPVVLRDLDENTQAEIEAEIDERSEMETANEDAMGQLSLLTMEGEAMQANQPPDALPPAAKGPARSSTSRRPKRSKE